MPLECPSFIDAGVADHGDGEGYETAQEVLDAISPLEKPAGEIRFTIESDTQTIWVYFLGDDKVGEVKAGKMDWGLWVLDTYERCIFDYFPTDSPVP